MIKSTWMTILSLTLVYLILCEEISLSTIVFGLFFSSLCVYICSRVLPGAKSANLRFARLAFYPVFLVAQVYLAGIAAIKLVIKGADVDVVQVQTQIIDPFLRTTLANSITLTPGTISLDLIDDRITVLWLKEKSKKGQEEEDPGEEIKGKFERMLMKMVK